MLLNERQLREIARIIADHHSAFVVNRIGPNAVAPETLARLRELGLINVRTSGVEDAYLYGMVVAAADDPKTKNMSLREFRQYVRRNPVPLTPVEAQAVKMAQAREAKYVVGLGNRIDTSTGALMIEADAKQRQALRTTITRQTEANVEARQSVKQLKSDLGWAMDDWTRDLERIAVTEKAAALSQGAADVLTTKYGADVPVSVLTAPSCCPQCARLYVGADAAPKVFALSQLVANGTNVGRKVAQWMPVLPPVHPHCVCVIVRHPPGYGYNAQNELVPGGTRGLRHEPQVAKAAQGPKTPPRRTPRPQLSMRLGERLRKAPAPFQRPVAKSVSVPVPDRNQRAAGLVGAALLFNPPPLRPPNTRFVGQVVRDVERDENKPAYRSFKRKIADYEQPDEGRARVVRPVAPPGVVAATAQSARERKRAIAARRRMLARMAQLGASGPVDAVRSVFKVGR